MFRVDWLLAAQNELAQIWMNADSALRRQVSDSAQRIDQLLRVNPHERGEGVAHQVQPLPLGNTERLSG